MHNNQNKTVSANSKGIIVSFRDVHKHKFIPYESQYVNQIQLHGTTKYQELEVEVFNPSQRRIYDEALYGFAVYSNKEIQELSPSKKHFIQKNYHKVQRFLAKWKEELLIQRIDNYLLQLFYKSPLIKEFVDISRSEYKFETNFDRLSDELVARKLVEYKLLPSNFFNLN